MTDFAARHWLLIDQGRVTGCHCGKQASVDDHYGDTMIAHIYDQGFLDGINATGNNQ